MIELMYVVCCKCREFIDVKPGKLGKISHGLCNKCYHEELAQLEKYKKERQHAKIN